MFWNKKEIKKLQDQIRKLCKCEQFSVNKGIISQGEPMLFEPSPFIAVDNANQIAHEFFCECDICERQWNITKKQYLTYKKETIESSLKECE